MYISAVIILSLLVGGLCFFVSLKFLRRFSWFFAWLRGSLGFAFLGASVLILLIAIDLSSYEELMTDKPLASITFEQVGEQRFNAHISYYIDLPAASFELSGDQWQVDARIVRWTGLVGALGAKPGFKLDRISGRYYSLEEERRKQRSVFELNDTKPIIDFWPVLNNYGDFIPGIDTVYGSAAYLPMANLANYQLSLSANGLTAKPVNEIAKSAVNLWR